MKENKKLSDREIILEGLRAGKLMIEIAEDTTVTSSQVGRIKDKLIQEGKITKKEIEEAIIEKERKRLQTDSNIQKMLEYARQGLSNIKIAEMEDIEGDCNTVERAIKKCIKYGLITEKEIEKAKQDKKERDKNNNSNIKRILKGLRAGEFITDITKDTTIAETQVHNIKNKLIEEGIITQEEIDNARARAKIERESKRLQTDSNVKKMLEYFRKGLSYTQIAKMEDISGDRNKVKKEIEKCIKFGIISEELHKNRKSDREIILEGLRVGKNMTEIVESTTVKVQQANKIKQKLIKEGVITQEEIDNARARAKVERESKRLQTDSNVQKILEYVREGLSYSEIVNKEDILGERHKVTNEVKKCIKFGLITEKEIEEARNNNSAPKEQAEIEGVEEDVVLEGQNQGLGQLNDNAKMDETEGNIIWEDEEEELSEPEKKEKYPKKTFDRLEKEIGIDLKYSRKISPEKKEKVREYIDACYEIYDEEKMPKEKLNFLGQALQKIPIEDKDIIRFSKRCIKEGEYEHALKIVRNRHQMQRNANSKDREVTLKKLEKALTQACKVQEAIQIIRKGNGLIEVISETTGLSNEQINILKWKLSGKTRKILKVEQRDKMVDLLVKDKFSAVRMIQQKLEISDLEMADIEEQAKYRRIEAEKRDMQAEIKQNSTIRIVVLCTKLGKKPEKIAKLLNIDVDLVQQDIQKALGVGLIKENELQGIKIIDSEIIELEKLIA